MYIARPHPEDNMFDGTTTTTVTLSPSDTAAAVAAVTDAHGLRTSAN